ncbi:MAG: serine/threonine-protein kinase [Victivallaceae bacterium]|nr:serine/threonine-protein kinase [Victivallaceae bacterium]
MKKIIGRMEYEILEVIAEGGMGAVFKALMKGANGFEKVVAIKTLLNCYSKDKRFINRFIDEAKLVANLIHENIVQIYQLDRYMDEYYFVLEYVDGITLHDFLEFLRVAKTRLPVKLAVFIAMSVARALAYAHSRYGCDGRPLNIVHCDVCSHNILINTEGVVKLTDFGVARAVTVKERNSYSGKLPFMSPEQVKKQSLDFRSDIYSLGVVLFNMLSGGKPCRHLNVHPHEIILQAQQNYIDWELLPKDLDEELLAVLRCMLATDPDKRYPSTAKTMKKLEQYILRRGNVPTIVTLAKYMRHEMPALFEGKPEYRRNGGNGFSGGEEEILKTLKIPGNFDPESDPGRLSKTRPMNAEELLASGTQK